MTLPTFLVIGAMKAGTTSMHRYLGFHPQVFTTQQKELNFFTKELNWDRGWEWYEAQFAEAAGAVARGESSPGYSSFPWRQGVPERIASRIPDIRLIYIVRDPLVRLQSQYTHRVLRGEERRPPEEAVLDDRYLGKSLYALQIKVYLEHFSRDQLLVVSSEELRERRTETLQPVFAFLGVDSGWGDPVLDTEFHLTAEKLSAAEPQSRTRQLVSAVRRRGRTPPVVRGSEATVVPPFSASLIAELRARVADDQHELEELAPGITRRWGQTSDHVQ